MQILSKTSVQGLISDGKDLKPFWNGQSAKIASHFALPCADSDLTLLNGLSKGQGASWFSTELSYHLSLSLPEIYYISCMSFPVGCTDLETVVSRLIRLSPTAEQKKIFKNWTDVSRWVFNWTVDFIRSCVGWTPTWMDIKKYATRFLPEWTKKVPFQIKGIAIKEACEAFAAFYSPNISGKIGEGDFARIYRLLLHLDRLYSRRAKANRRNKKSLTKAIRRMTAKIRNLTTELHWKTARFLCENFAVILMPTYETKQMVKKAGRKIRSKTVRSMLGFANYKFRQRLKWMAERLGVTVLDVSESYTSKTHPQTGEVRNIGSAKRIKLTDGSVADRDLAGAYNILIKFLTEYCTLGDTPVVCN